MDSGLEEAGALATAAAAAREIDPGAARDTVHGGACANCGAALSGAYCSACGQKAHLHRSVFHAVEEFLHGILHFDSKLWYTLPLLLFRPGRLTRDYVMGRRARYIAPVALFLLTVFTMFLVFGFLPTPGLEGTDLQMSGKERQAAATAIREEMATLDANLAQARARQAADPASEALRQEVVRLETAQSLAKAAKQRLEGGGTVASPADVVTAITGATRTGGLTLDLGSEDVNAKVRRALSDPEFMFYKMKQKGYKLSFLLVPMSLPWLMLLFAWKRDVKAYDHVVFLLYSISFMSMLVILTALLAAAFELPRQVYAFLLLVVPVLHMFAQLKEGYALSWFSAAWRTVVVSSLALVTLTVYFVGILLLGMLD